MLQKLRLAVVGLGRICKSHLPAVRELAHKIELAALVTRDQGKLQQAAEQWAGVKTYTSYDDAVNDPDIDASCCFFRTIFMRNFRSKRLTG